MERRPLGKILAGYCFYDGCKLRPLKVCFFCTYYYQEERRKGKTAWEFVRDLYKLFVSCRFPAAFRAVIVVFLFRTMHIRDIASIKSLKILFQIFFVLQAIAAQESKYFTVRNKRRRRKEGHYD